MAHYNLGGPEVLRPSGGGHRGVPKADPARRALRRSALQPGRSAQEQGRVPRGPGGGRRGHELGSRRPGWPYPSLQWVRRLERLVELDAKLPGILDGTTRPVGPGERIEWAGFCSLKRLNRAAARLYEEAFAEDARLANDLGAAHRYNAARAAVLAGTDRGKDADQLDDEGRVHLRRHALDWLRADLDAWIRWLDNGPDEARPILVAKMRHWQTDTDLTGVRGPAALARMPEPERLAWQELWSGVADTLAPVQTRTSPEKKSGTK